jgi:hypothetical protein
MDCLNYHQSIEKHILQDSRREKLIALGPEKLVFALLESAIRNPRVDELVNRLGSEKAENLKRYYEKLQYLSRREKFYDWKTIEIFIAQLDDVLKLLEDGVSTPEEGIKGIFAFFEVDVDICESCKDDGDIVMFYEYDVCGLFVRYASDCKDKEWLFNEIIRLSQKDDYGCRDCLYKCALKLFPELESKQLYPRGV